jgi:hypothetical protein
MRLKAMVLSLLCKLQGLNVQLLEWMDAPSDHVREASANLLKLQRELNNIQIIIEAMEQQTGK